MSLANFGLDYLDLFLIHWPVAYAEEAELFPRTADGKVITSEVDYLDTWKAMEKLVQKGLVKAIGVSNFNSEQLQRILDNCTVKPVVNQVAHAAERGNVHGVLHLAVHLIYSIPRLPAGGVPCLPQPEQDDRLLQGSRYPGHRLQPPGLSRQALGQAR